MQTERNPEDDSSLTKKSGTADEWYHHVLPDLPFWRGGGIAILGGFSGRSHLGASLAYAAALFLGIAVGRSKVKSWVNAMFQALCLLIFMEGVAAAVLCLIVPLGPNNSLEDAKIVFLMVAKSIVPAALMFFAGLIAGWKLWRIQTGGAEPMATADGGNPKERP